MAASRGEGSKRTPGAEALLQRPNRSRLIRPCDRCRHRKQRCHLTLVEDDEPTSSALCTPCTNCQAVKVPCTFDQPPRRHQDSQDPRSEGRKRLRLSTTAYPRQRHQSPGSSQQRSEDAAGRGDARSTGDPTDGLDIGDSAPSTGHRTSPHPSYQGPFAGASLLRWQLKHCSYVREEDEEGDYADSCESPRAGLPRAGRRRGDSQAGASGQRLSSPGADLALGKDESRDSAVMAHDPSHRNSVDVGHQLPARSNAAPPSFFVWDRGIDYGIVDHSAMQNRVVRNWEASLTTAQRLRLVQRFYGGTALALPIFGMAAQEEVQETAQLQGHRHSPDPSPPNLTRKMALAASILAHSCVYESELRRHHYKLWQAALAALDASFLQPNLETMAAVILDLVSRPNRNVTSNYVHLSKAVGAAYLIGLHRDCANWTLPSETVELRSALWWALVVNDTWTSLHSGRPCLISMHQSNVPTPSSGRRRDQKLETFPILCQLAMFARAFIRDFSSPSSYEALSATPWMFRRLANVSLKDVRGLYQTAKTQYKADRTSAGMPSLMLSFHGLTMCIHLADAYLARREMRSTSFEMQGALQTADPDPAMMQAIEEFLEYLESLTARDLESFWISYSAQDLSTCLAVLLLLLAEGLFRHHEDAALRASMSQLERFLRALHKYRHQHSWDIADRSIIKARRELSGIKQRLLQAQASERLRPIARKALADLYISWYDSHEHLVCNVPDEFSPAHAAAETRENDGSFSLQHLDPVGNEDQSFAEEQQTFGQVSYPFPGDGEHLAPFLSYGAFDFSSGLEGLTKQASGQGQVDFAGDMWQSLRHFDNIFEN